MNWPMKSKFRNKIIQFCIKKQRKLELNLNLKMLNFFKNFIVEKILHNKLSRNNNKTNHKIHIKKNYLKNKFQVKKSIKLSYFEARKYNNHYKKYRQKPILALKIFN